MAAVTIDQVIGSARVSARGERLGLLWRSPTFLVGSAIVLFWAASAIFGRLLVPHDPFQPDILHGLTPPSPAHWFGTDNLGRDVFARVIVGARGILTVAPLATLVGTFLGTSIGLIAGFFRGLVDDLLMRAVDAFLAVPVVIVGLLALVALGPSNLTVILVIGIVFTPLIARTVRAAVLAERELEYVQAAQLRKENALYTMFVEILPNVLPPVLVEFTVRLGYAIFVTATLSFLGFGIQPPAPDWGLTIFQQYIYLIGGAWWPALFPAFAIASLVIGVNLVSDGLVQVFGKS
ncbi:MAG TPA: ABC transporter permease [Candidatus Dormibacteraeota bacterium]|nr:ABC transporter permease [Candidatus Dormibacteraeota bacterium]